jgi:dephospho-CoA kinase
MASKKVILGVSGEIASGKDTVGNYLAEAHGASKLRFSQPLRDMLDRLGIEQNRENMAKLSLYIRKAFGEDILSRVILAEAEASTEEFVVVDGIRRLPDMVHMETDEHFYFCYVEANPEKRFERLTQRRQNTDDASKTAMQFEKDSQLETEIGIRDLKERADFVIDNNGTLEDLKKQTDDMVGELKRRMSGE